MAIERTDDGTLDTVLRCSECGEEMRYNFDGEDGQPTNDAVALLQGAYRQVRQDRLLRNTVAHAIHRLNQTHPYTAYVAECIEEATAGHECPTDEPRGPQEGDITTEDHETFYQDGKRVLWLTAHGVSDDHDRALERGGPMGSAIERRARADNPCVEL